MPTSCSVPWMLAWNVKAVGMAHPVMAFMSHTWVNVAANKTVSSEFPRTHRNGHMAQQ